MDKNQLRWPDPQNRHMDEIHRSRDTGLCNRLFHWEVAQEINKHNNFKFDIILGESYWPELKELIHLPNTKVISELEKDSYSKKYKSLIGDSNPLKMDKMQEMFLTQNFFLEDMDYHSDFEFRTISDLYSLDEVGEDTTLSNRPIKNIFLKNKELENMIKDITSDMIGIHVRRGRGIKYNDVLLGTLPKDIQQKYLQFRGLEGDAMKKFYLYDFVTDTEYFRVIDDIIKNYPNKKIYISHDLPDELFEYFFEKYPNKILTKKYFYEYIEGKFTTSNHHVLNVIDLFCLSHTFLLYKHPTSTWSEFSDAYTEKESYYLKTTQKII